MTSIWDFLDSLPKRSDVTPEELARRRQGYADLYQGGLLASNRDQMPLSVQGAQATQDFLPVIGDALALGEAGEALSRGELAAAGLLGTAGIIGLVPGAGDALAKPVMAAGRRAADIARRIEVDPNALGSMGGNIRLRPQAGGALQNAPKSLAEKIESKYPDVTVDLFGSPERGYELSRIIVPQAERGAGMGTRVMEDMIQMADEQGARISLTPDTSFGGSSTSRLKDFYKRFGFVENKGKNKDFSTRNTMYRPPQAPSPAQEVAGLLSSGRADEVTDEMLAKFTPKDEMEIFDLYQRGATGIDLPMDEASRMARAAEQERTANQFHGAMGDYRDLRPSVRGKIGPGVYTAEEPNYANSFAGKVYGEDEYLEGGNVYPLMVKDNPAPDMFRTEAGALRRSVSDPFEGAALFSRHLDDLGFSGVKVGGEQTTVNPSNIRSRFARFDPRLAHLRNLSAGVGGLGLLSSMMPPEEQY